MDATTLVCKWSVPETNKLKYFVSRKIKTSNGAIFVYDGLYFDKKVKNYSFHN